MITLWILNWNLGAGRSLNGEPIVYLTSGEENADQLDTMMMKIMNWQANIMAYTSTAPEPISGS